MSDLDELERAFRLQLGALPVDPTAVGMRDTPRRAARALADLTQGYEEDPQAALGQPFFEDHHELVVVSDLPLWSLCEHHLLPFFGKAHVAYLPSGPVVGLSKLARLVDCCARRLQVQERLTAQVADAIWTHDVLKAEGSMVVVEAEHLCMTMRGVRKAGTVTRTSAVRGSFADNYATRAEALALMGVGGS